MIGFLATALRVEAIKLRRTLALGLALAAPLIVVMLQLILFSSAPERFLQPGANPWQLMLNVGGLWNILMLPPLIALQTALLAGLEHGSGQWKHLYALPVPRSAFYAAKIGSALALVGIAFLLLGAGIVVSGYLLRLVEPGMAAGPIPWRALGKLLGFSYVACWLTVTLHTWVALRWPSFTVAMGVGIMATVTGFVAVNSERFVVLYPWTLPVNALREGAPLAALMLYSVLGACVVGLAGCRAVTSRDAP